MMSFNSLPHEIVEQIIDSISDHPYDYSSYSLVSRGWFRRCRHHAFGTLVLWAERDHPFPESIARSINPFVRELVVRRSSSRRIEKGETSRWTNIKFLTHLKRVTVNNGGHWPTHGLFQYLYPAIKGNAPIMTIVNTGATSEPRLPTNLALVLREASELYLTYAGGLLLSDVEHIRNNPGPANLKHLLLITSTYENLQLHARIISVGPSHLQSLMINAMCPLWQEVVHALGPSLEHFVLLSVQMRGRDPNRQPTVVPDLSANPNLKTIGCELEPPWYKLTQATYAVLLKQMLSSVSPTLKVELLIDSNEDLDQIPEFQSTIEQLASTRPSVSFHLFNHDLDRKFGAGRFGPPIKPYMRSPDLYLKHWFPHLYGTGRMRYRTKRLDEHTFSDLQQYVT